MRSVYRVLAFVIAAEVVVQAAAIAFAVYGLGRWVEDGGTLDKTLLERDDSSVGGAAGFAIHGVNGTMVVPVLALVLLVVSFFAAVPGGAKWAGAVFALVVVQAALGFVGQGVPAARRAARRQRARAVRGRGDGRQAGRRHLLDGDRPGLSAPAPPE